LLLRVQEGYPSVASNCVLMWRTIGPWMLFLDNTCRRRLPAAVSNTIMKGPTIEHLGQSCYSWQTDYPSVKSIVSCLRTGQISSNYYY